MKPALVEQAKRMLLSVSYCSLVPLTALPASNTNAKSYLWPGPQDEDVVVGYYDGIGLNIPHHDHDFFFFNYVLAGSYDIVDGYGNVIDRAREGDLIAGPPFVGHGFRQDCERRVSFQSIFVRKDAFAGSAAYTTHDFKPDFQNLGNGSGGGGRACLDVLHLGLGHPVNDVIDLMTVTYAFKGSGYRQLLRSFVEVLDCYVAQQADWRRGEAIDEEGLSHVPAFIDNHLADVTLRMVADHFSYNPSYLSGLIKKKLGKTFTQIVLERRMHKCVTLLVRGKQPVEEIAVELGYSSLSGFYRAFHAFYGMTPKEYLRMSAQSKDWQL